MIDVGCGRGLRLLSFRRLGLDVHGMDPDPGAGRVREERTQRACGFAPTWPACRVRSGQAPLDDGDGLSVIEHVPDVDEMIASCFELPAGWVVIATPMVDACSRRCSAAAGRGHEAPRHLSLATKKGLRIALERHGFTDVLCSYDSVWMSAGHFGLSAFPGAATTHFYTRGKISALVMRALGAGAAVLAMPLCWLENMVWKRPAIGMIFARKAE